MGDLISRNKMLEEISLEANFMPCGKTATEEALEKWINKQPSVEAIPVAHLDIEKSEILDILDKIQFFLGKRECREIWNIKPTDMQEEDLENFNKDIQKIKEYLINVKPIKHGEWIGDKWWRECSECGNTVSSSKTTKFCNECGADMRRI
ncbi:MAG: hypothetical protein IKV59_02945 [Lachnospiraceae bacterium]|nr:hypothetical protein [Lachnospiraceae bacterium]